MAENLEEVRQDRSFWQRLMRFAGYYKGEIDGIIGRQSQAAAAAWQSAAEAHRAELGSFDERSERNIATLTPETQRLARLWLSQAKAAAQAEGMDVRIICGTRTYKEQDALYRKRPRVTKARGGQSMHPKPEAASPCTTSASRGTSASSRARNTSATTPSTGSWANSTPTSPA